MILAIAHQTETFARQKHLLPLETYIERAKKEAKPKTQAEHNKELIEMFRRLQQRGAPVKVERIVQPRKE